MAKHLGVLRMLSKAEFKRQSELVAYCPVCTIYLEPEEAGDMCPGDCNARLRLRRGVICSECELQPIFFTPANLAQHVAEHLETP